MTLHDRVRHAHAEVQLARFTKVVEQLDVFGLANPDDQDVARMWPQVEHAVQWLASRADDDDTAAARLSRIMLGATGMLTIGEASHAQREEWTRAALRAAQRLGLDREIRAHYGGLGAVLLDREDFVAAVECFESALGGEADPHLQAPDFLGLARAYAALGRQTETENLFGTALTAFVEAGDRRGEVVARIHRCRAHLASDEPQAALTEMTAIRRLIDHDGAPVGKEVLRLQLDVWAYAGQTRRALDHADRWVSAMREDLSLAEVRLARGFVNLVIGRPDAAVPDLTAAQQIAQAHRADKLLYDVLVPLGVSYRNIGRFDDSRAALVRRQELAASGGTNRRWQAITDLAHTANAAGDLARARILYQQALDLVTADTKVVAGQEIRDRQAIALSRSALADIDVRTRKSDAWQGHDAAIAESGSSVRLQVRILDQAGRSAFAVDDHERRLTYQRRRSEILEDLDDPRALAHALGECADALKQLDRYAEAINLYERVAELDREVGNHHDETHVLCDIADVHAMTGNFDISFSFYEQAARMAACHDHREVRISALTGMAMVLDASHPVVAASCLMRAWILAAAIGHESVSYIDERLSALPDADVELLRRKAIAEQDLAAHATPGQALNHLREAVDLAAAARDQDILWSALDTLAGAAQAAADLPLAVETLLDAEALAVVAGAHEAEDAVLGHMSRLVEMGLGNADAATTMLRRRLDRAISRGDTYAQMRSLMGLARVAIGTVDEDLAPALLEEALHLARTLHDPVAEVDVLGLSGAIERRHDLADQSDALTRAIFLAEQHCPDTLPNLRRLNE